METDKRLKEEMVFSSSPVEPLSERKTIVVRQENTLRRDVSRGQKHLTIASLRPRDITYISCILLPQTLDLKVISLSRGLWRRIPWGTMVSFQPHII